VIERGRQRERERERESRVRDGNNCRRKQGEPHIPTRFYKN
jgi:hypothetical protein